MTPTSSTMAWRTSWFGFVYHPKTICSSCWYRASWSSEPPSCIRMLSSLMRLQYTFWGNTFFDLLTIGFMRNWEMKWQFTFGHSANERMVSPAACAHRGLVSPSRSTNIGTYPSSCGCRSAFLRRKPSSSPASATFVHTVCAKFMLRRKICTFFSADVRFSSATSPPKKSRIAARSSPSKRSSWSPFASSSFSLVSPCSRSTRCFEYRQHTRCSSCSALRSGCTSFANDADTGSGSGSSCCDWPSAAPSSGCGPPPNASGAPPPPTF
mmetsp:Transcript_11118/g.27183  ORF Transcript_11118/g.27183 Transcript_11118/m.27183 type:complete len:267 (-) Transcript_11118:1919-2719(-)